MSRDAEELRRTANGPSPGTPSIYSALKGLRGMAVHILYLALANPDHPVSQVTGRIDEVRTNAVTLAIDGKLPRLETHIRCGVEVFAPSGLIHFQARPVSVVEAGSDSLCLALPDRVETLQRRRFARVPFSGGITFQRVHNGKPAPSVGEGSCIDLSAGGVRLVTPSAFRDGQDLLVSFQTPDGRNYRGIAAKVVRVERQEGQYVLACRFESLTETQEAALVQTIFRMQIRSAGR